jgi:multidrug efflux system outer membrane protein
MKSTTSTLLTSAAAALLGCTMTPQYHRPQAEVPSRLPEGGAYPAALGTNLPPAADLRWKQFYPDPRMQEVIGLALTNNLDLRTAASNVRYFRALYGIQGSAMLPSVAANGTFTRQRVPHDLSAPGSPALQSSHSLSLGVVAWELDFWGRIRSLKESALQEYLATEHGRRGAEVSIIAAVAGTYLAVAADQESLAIAQTTLETQQRSYELVNSRFKLGLTHELDLDRAQTQVDNARRDAATYQQQLAQDINALNFLAGVQVPLSLLATNLAGILPPRELAGGLSSDVLLTRPDVLQAEAQLKSANANIGAARAAFFPRITLMSALGTASSDLNKLFTSDARTWSVAPQVTLPIFEPGTWYALRAGKARREMMVLQYQKSIQSAFRDVADALAVKGTVDERLSAQESLVQANTSTYRLSDSRYLKGIDSYLSVLDAQRSLYAAQQGLVGLRLAKMASGVQLYAALGGGSFEEGAPVAAKTVATKRQ